MTGATPSMDVSHAEAYWDKEWELQQQGFDYCYDKRLYDRLEHNDLDGLCCIARPELSEKRPLPR